jgi:hypothetical protein
MMIATFEPLGANTNIQQAGTRKVAKVSTDGSERSAGVNDAVGGWVYMGSHNFGSSAWVSNMSIDGCEVLTLLVRCSGNLVHEQWSSPAQVSDQTTEG